MSQIFFRNAWSYVWFNCHSGVTTGRRLGRKIVLVPNHGHPEKSDQLRFLPDILLQLRVEGGNNKVCRYQDDDTTTNQWCWKRFADRGLVANGTPNTRLLHQLYWRIAWYKNAQTAPKSWSQLGSHDEALIGHHIYMTEQSHDSFTWRLKSMTYRYMTINYMKSSYMTLYLHKQHLHDGSLV